MALTTIEMIVNNNEFKGCVEISTVLKTDSVGNISYLLLFRRESDFNNNYEKIYEKEINDIDDLLIHCTDLTTQSGHNYDYYIELANGNGIDRIVYEFDTIYDVQSWFDGLFIGDETTQYLAPLDCETSTVRNTQENYVTTLLGRTPYRISNSNLNYTTGSSSALFMPLDENMNPIKQDTKDYINQVVSFLSNGDNKILKTSDGDIWYVSIDQNIQIDFNDRLSGYNRISFDWTEVDDVPYIVNNREYGSSLINKTIVANGAYYPSDDHADGYNYVYVNVPTVNVRVQGHTLVYESNQNNS